MHLLSSLIMNIQVPAPFPRRREPEFSPGTSATRIAPRLLERRASRTQLTTRCATVATPPPRTAPRSRTLSPQRTTAFAASPSHAWNITGVLDARYRTYKHASCVVTLPPYSHCKYLQGQNQPHRGIKYVRGSDGNSLSRCVAQSDRSGRQKCSH
ncbi:uncharacterized protein BDW47DRAFT_110691 [Aspergillus candidus]|uniref:Uncharacterized protein n=1 Tax=Aspergillus candidus TaxID=41067 RepID=A0A2I2F3K1_ASPCN|nr:hypothetical protein BDW47DRAFT_110691 [Aspergillus candidus]PLB35220.1 hypothetical protein BDW47DRAFT_110691 [Aspergillus candidus]